MALDQFFDAKHEGCIVSAKTRAIRKGEFKAVRCAQVVEVQRGNKTTIWSLAEWDGQELSDSRQICEAFHQYFGQLLEGSNERRRW